MTGWVATRAVALALRQRVLYKGPYTGCPLGFVDRRDAGCYPQGTGYALAFCNGSLRWVQAWLCGHAHVHAHVIDHSPKRTSQPGRRRRLDSFPSRLRRRPVPALVRFRLRHPQIAEAALPRPRAPRLPLSPQRLSHRCFSAVSPPNLAHFTPSFARSLRLGARKPETAKQRRKDGAKRAKSGREIVG